MSEPLERWNDDAPEPFRAAKAAYGRLGPDAERLERMLEHVERAAAMPGAGEAARLWLVSKAWYWLLPVLSLLGVAWLWALTAKHEPDVPKPLVIERAAQLAPPAAQALPREARADTEHAPPPAPAAARGSTSRPRTLRSSDPLAELALLDRARRVIGKAPARALALAEEHAREYRSGQFAEERELLAVEALVRLERRAAAQQRARAFLRAHPNSVHAHRLGVILSPAAR